MLKGITDALGEERSTAVTSLDNVNELIAHMDKVFSTYWKKNVSYGTHRLVKMKSQKVLLPRSLQRVLNYVKKLNYVIDIHHSSPNLMKEVVDEVRYWEQESGYCIHLSILVKVLIEQIDPTAAKKIHYYQGCSTLHTEVPMAAMLFGPIQKGIHSWLTYGNAVIDVTSIQHKHSIKLPQNSYDMVIGEFGPNYELEGFKESQKTFEEYLELFSNKAGLSVSEWLEMHLNALELSEKN